MSRIAKISVQKFDSKDEILYDFDKSMGLDKNILSICKKVDVPESTKIYGLMYMPVGTDNEEIEHYISESNYEEIKHNDRLKVVFSLQYILERIVKYLKSDNEHERRIAFEDIHKHSLDPIFIDDLERTGIDEIILKIFVDEQLPSNFQLGVLRTVVHLFSKDYIHDTSVDILSKCLRIMKITDTSNDELVFVLSLLQKILLTSNEVFVPWKERILNELSLTDIIVYTWYDTSPTLQLRTLSLINTLLKVSKSDKKEQIIKQLNQKKNRENIFEHIILPGNVSKKMEHELYVLQTYLFNLFTEALNKKISLDEKNLYNREQFELGKEDMRRITILMDFDDTSLRNPINNISVEDLAFNNRNSTISLASVMSDDSNKSVKKRPISEYELNGYISYLTFETLKYYKDHHQKNFYQSQIEEHLYEPGIFVTSERVIKMLTKLLHIGVDTPDNKSTMYQPLVFHCDSKTPFLSELFSRTMWLLSRTRREMKASSFADYEKVMYVLRKQVKMALKTRPQNFKSLTVEMTNITFQTVLDKIMSDKEQEMKNMLANHPCLQELKEKFKILNREYVIQHRIQCLLEGQRFIQFEDKKVTQDKKKYTVHLQLTKNKKEFTLTDEQSKKCRKENYSLEDVTHIVIGKNCQHSNLCDTPGQAFCIIIKHVKHLQFKADDEKTAAYWTDGFLLLTKKDTAENLSSYYKEELNKMIEIDLRVQLLELQNVHIPKSPPVVPPLPAFPRPEVPPRPKHLKTNRKN